MDSSLSQKCQLIHLKWQELTKLNRPFNCGDYLYWEMFFAAGYTSADLELVVTYIWKRIKEGQRQKESFKLSNLLEPSRFADDLAFARPAQREVKPSPRDKILAATGRADPKKDPEQVKEVVTRCMEQIRKEIQ